MTIHKPVRVALRMPSGALAAYLAASANRVSATDGAELCLVMHVRGAPRRAADRRARVLDRMERLYTWLEWRFLRGGPDALIEGTLGSWPASTRVVTCASLDEQVKALEAARCDVVIDLMPDDVDIPSLIPPAGWWRTRFAVGVGGPRGSSLGRPRTPAALAESLLRVVTPDGHVHEAEVGIGALRRIGFGRDASAIYWRGSQLPARHLARLVANGGISVPMQEVPTPTPRQDPVTAHGISSAPPFVGLLRTVAGKVLDRLIYQSAWTVFVRPREAGQGLPRDLEGFTAVEAPAGRFYADPFVVQDADTTRLYVEDCPLGTHRGRISALTLDPDGHWAMERVVLADLSHRAYPHTLRTAEGLVITPDGGTSDGVDIFVDEGLDRGVVRVARCLDGMAASDPTLLVHEGRYWLFVALAGHGMALGDELHLYSARALTGPWEAHPRNPIVADVRRSRPAGRILTMGGQLLRPGQDGSLQYGGRITWSRVTVLAPADYEEYPIGSVEPHGAPAVSRTHTYSVDGGFEALDGYRRVPRWRRHSKGAA